MSSLTKKIKKLKGLKREEISVRVAQQFAILSERSGLSKQGSLPSDDELVRLVALNSTSAFVERLRLRDQSRFFPSFASQDLTVAEFRRRWPEAAPPAAMSGFATPSSDANGRRFVGATTNRLRISRPATGAIAAS